MPGGGGAQIESRFDAPTATGGSPSWLREYSVETWGFTLNANWVGPLTERIRAFAGAGVLFSLAPDTHEGGEVESQFDAGGAGYVDIEWKFTPRENLTIPLLRTGVEWKPLDRLGVAVWADYRFLVTRTLTMDAWTTYVTGTSATTISEEEIQLGEWALPKLVISGSLSFYF